VERDGLGTEQAPTYALYGTGGTAQSGNKLDDILN